MSFFFDNQDVKYPEYLDLRAFMSQSQGEPQVYGLYAVLVHSGFSCHAGHYFCYIKVLALLQTTVLIYQDSTVFAKYTCTHLSLTTTLTSHFNRVHFKIPEIYKLIR